MMNSTNGQSGHDRHVKLIHKLLHDIQRHDSDEDACHEEGNFQKVVGPLTKCREEVEDEQPCEEDAHKPPEPTESHSTQGFFSQLSRIQQSDGCEDLNSRHDCDQGEKHPHQFQECRVTR